MAASAKNQKDKPYVSAPRLAPRATAASAARAARNATNRNLSMQPTQKHSPSRITSAPANKMKPLHHHNTSKCDSKTDFQVPTRQASDAYLIDSPPALVEDTRDGRIDYAADNVSEIHDTSMNETFELNHGENNLEEESKSLVSEIVYRSRPQTPAKSRPITPKTAQTSRPQTPLTSSRPTTPAHPQRHSIPGSRPNTPGEPKNPSSLPVSPLTRNLTNGQTRSAVKEDEDIKSTYLAKQRQFQCMKKELDLKQQATLELFDCLRDLNERMAREGIAGSGEGFQMGQELVVFNVGDWTAEEMAQLCREALSSSVTDGAIELINTSKPIDECALQELDAKVTKVPSCFAALCLQAFTARQELIDWVKELLGRSDVGCGESLDRIAQYNAQGLQLCEALRDIKSQADVAVDTVTQLSRRACRERTALIAVGESLIREIARLRQDLEARAMIVNEMREIRAENETAKVLEDTRRELEEERAARAVQKEKLATAESQLRQTRIRVSKMDRQLREAEASISSLTGAVKSLEDQSRQKEVQLEARARKLKESLKTGEVTSNQIAVHRDALQAEVQSLKEQIETLTTQHKTAVQELSKEIKDLKSSIEEQRKITQNEVELRKCTEAKLEEYEQNIDDLKAKNVELESSRPNPELPTEREMDLWAELQATKETLRMTEDEMSACKREKVRFLETLTKIAESENKVGMQQKLAAELQNREEIVNKMQIQIRELTKNIKLNEQKVIQYEQYVRDLHAHTRAVANCQEAPNGISYQDLQQEIMNLRMGLLETVHRNEDLSEMLAQKEQQLEHQDKTSRAQARVIKVNKQIAAKADEIQELFTTLENKQQQIHRLEKIVMALEEQQRRAQAQRTRHEEKIAALEHELAAGNRRERKFIFF